MKRYQINFAQGSEAEKWGLQTPEKQSQRTNLWLMGMSEALEVVAPSVIVKVIISQPWWLQFETNNFALAAMIEKRIAGFGATMIEVNSKGFLITTPI